MLVDAKLAIEKYRLKIESLSAQVAELTKDAERYRWLCVSARVTKMIASSFLDPANSKADIDGMIDAAKEGK